MHNSVEFEKKYFVASLLDTAIIKAMSVGNRERATTHRNKHNPNRLITIKTQPLLLLKNNGTYAWVCLFLVKNEPLLFLQCTSQNNEVYIFKPGFL